MDKPISIGILNDMSAAPPGPSDMQQWLQLVVDEARSSGRLKNQVQFINAWGLGLPSGTAAAVENAYRELAEQDVVVIVGPAIGDNALIATPLADEFEIPTINWAGTERARNEYMFHLQVGSHEDEAILLARYLAKAGSERVAMIYDDSPIGTRYRGFLEAEADILGIAVMAAEPLNPIADDANDIVEKLLVSNPEAVLYLGLGYAFPAVSQALTSRGWKKRKAMTTAGIRGYSPDFATCVDDWVYVDMVADNNQTLAGLCSRLNLNVNRRLAAAKGYDLGRLLVEGLARAPEVSRKGVKAGLEKIKLLPAAEGREGTYLAFGNWDRGALHGPYLVLRKWVGGQSMEIK